MIEVWKDVVGFKDYYQISNLGRVKSLERYKKNYSKLQLVEEKILKQSISKRGYYVVNLCNGVKCRPYGIHTLVGKAFVTNPNNYTQINHIDGDKLNNSIDNLEWSTQSHNMKHAWKNGLVGTNMEVVRNNDDGSITTYFSPTNASEENNCCRETIRKYCKDNKNKKWRFLKDESN